MTFETDLEVVLAKWQARLAERKAPQPTGYSKNLIAQVSKRLPKPLPPEIQRFYEVFTPESWKIATNDSGDPIIDPLESIKWLQSYIYLSEAEAVDSVILEAPPGPLEPGWLLCGGFGRGDCLIWCEKYRSYPHSILFVYIEGGPLGKGSPLILGESLGVWLDRLFEYDGMEYADENKRFFESGLSPEKQNRFLDHHLRLNPEDKRKVEMWRV